MNLNTFSKVFWIAKGVGWDNVPRRVYQSFRTRSGILRRQLAKANSDKDRFLESQRETGQVQRDWSGRLDRFFPLATGAQLHQLVNTPLWQSMVTCQCQAAVAGQYSFFSHWQAELGWPPNFNRDPVNQLDWPVGPHWLTTARSGPPRNDIKLVWEPSRFSLAFALAREYQYSGEEQWAEYFWEMFDAWIAQNPVNHSVAWGCGQEIAFRIMAMLTAAFSMLGSTAATSTRLQRLERLCWQSAKRIEANINYAISQENNHALSEATGLWTIGLLFPEFPESAHWRRLGRRVLESEVLRQIYDDGSYIQHSMSYHRVMLDDLCWAIQLGRINHDELSTRLVTRVGKAALWLSEFVDRTNGRVPNYGANDGANVLPLSCNDYLDYRPTLQLAAEVCGVHPGLSAGPWSEKTLWLTGKLPEAEDKQIRNDHWRAQQGGYFVMRGPHSQMMTRATRYRDRPGQCDLLHVDLWYRGYNVFRDAGSFYYYHNDVETKSYFYSVVAHNTVQVDTTEQMTKGPNFLWFHWPIASAEFTTDASLQCRASISAGKNYIHHRNITRNQDTYTIDDEVDGADCFTVRWRLAPEFDWQITSHGIVESLMQDGTKIRISCHSDQADDWQMVLSESWESLYYGERTLCPAIEVTHASGRFTTKFEPIS